MRNSGGGVSATEHKKKKDTRDDHRNRRVRARDEYMVLGSGRIRTSVVIAGGEHGVHCVMGAAPDAVGSRGRGGFLS